jgi:hypothetical protein
MYKYKKSRITERVQLNGRTECVLCFQIDEVRNTTMRCSQKAFAIIVVLKLIRINLIYFLQEKSGDYNRIGLIQGWGLFRHHVFDSIDSILIPSRTDAREFSVQNNIIF